MAVLVLIVFVGGAWLWAYRTTPSASAITGELNAIPVNVTSEQLIRDGYIDLTKVGESSNVAVNEFLAEAKQQEDPRTEIHQRGEGLFSTISRGFSLYLLCYYNKEKRL